MSSLKKKVYRSKPHKKAPNISSSCGKGYTRVSPRNKIAMKLSAAEPEPPI